MLKKKKNLSLFLLSMLAALSASCSSDIIFQDQPTAPTPAASNSGPGESNSGPSSQPAQTANTAGLDPTKPVINPETPAQPPETSEKKPSCSPLPADCACAEACTKGKCHNDRCTVAAPCDPLPSAHYDPGTITVQRTRPQAEDDAVNPHLLTWEEVQEELKLVHYGGDTDSKALKFQGFFADRRIPEFAHSSHLKDKTDWWPVTVLGMKTAQSEIIYTPQSGYDLGGGVACMVLYVGDDVITCKYTREDDIVHGYTLHILGICPEPSLKALYESLKDSQDSRPQLMPEQALGRARSTFIDVIIRDSGSLMDPRSDKDWW